MATTTLGDGAPSVPSIDAGARSEPTMHTRLGETYDALRSKYVQPSYENQDLQTTGMYRPSEPYAPPRDSHFLVNLCPDPRAQLRVSTRR